MKVPFRTACLAVLFCAAAVSGQDNGSISPTLLKNRWPARWIAPPQTSLKDFGVFHFRKTFRLGSRPDRFIVHISADNRYRLFVNGVPVSSGPARGDLPHWRFETVDIASRLHVGQNVLAAVVWNFGEWAPWAQMGRETAFILQGNTEVESLVNTGKDWRVTQDRAYSPTGRERTVKSSFMVVGPGERVDGLQYPWGWTETDYDDSGWTHSRELGPGTPRGIRDGGMPWMLVPRNIPPMEEVPERIPRAARIRGGEIQPGFLQGKADWTIPPKTEVEVLLDQTHLTTAYPELTVSGGKGSEITLVYAEALFDNRGEKGNRNEIDGKQIQGYYDCFLPDGGSRRLYRPLWFRTYRYVQMEIRTKDQPLVLNDWTGIRTGYPFAEKAFFASSDSLLKTIWNIGWRTARLCAGETYFDCPYYEQLQYAGDTRIQAFLSLYVSGDDRLMRNAILQFDDSRIPDGLTASRYPSSTSQIIPPYSLFWVAMVYDYWMHHPDVGFAKSFLPGIDGVLDWYEKRVDGTGMLGPMPWWNFADWTPEWRDGVPSGAENGHSSLITLQLVYAMQMAAEMDNAFGRPDLADKRRKSADSLNQSVRRMCWDSRRGLLADTPEKIAFSQHTNTMAVLTNLIPKENRTAWMEKVSRDTGLIQCTFYYRYYLHRAMKKTGLGDRYLEMLQPWKEMVRLGLTTFAEKPEPTRSDCHAWSAHPLYEFLTTVCGIEPDSPGFRSVRIEPFLGPLKWVEGKIPHPLGEIHVNFTRIGEKGIEGRIRLPEELTGRFMWNGKEMPLKGGNQTVQFQSD